MLTKLSALWTALKSITVYAAIFACIGLAVYGLYTSERFSDYKESVMAEQARALAESFMAESQLYQQSTQVQGDLDAQLADIEFTASAYHAQLNSVQYHGPESTSSTNVLSDSAATTRSPQSGQNAESLAADLRVCKSALSKAKQRALDEAKDYDILATQYNALLKLYNDSKEVLDHGNKAN